MPTMRRNSRLGMIGFGALGREVMTALSSRGETGTLQAVLVRPGREAPGAVHDVQALIAARPEVVLECAGHSAVKELAAPLLRAGIDVIISSASSRNVTDPLGRIEASGAFGNFRFDIFARATADNLKASALTAYSILQCARLGGVLPISGL